MSRNNLQLLFIINTKMTQEALRQFVKELFLPCYLERNK